MMDQQLLYKLERVLNTMWDACWIDATIGHRYSPEKVWQCSSCEITHPRHQSYGWNKNLDHKPDCRLKRDIIALETYLKIEREQLEKEHGYEEEYDT